MMKKGFSKIDELNCLLHSDIHASDWGNSDEYLLLLDGIYSFVSEQSFLNDEIKDKNKEVTAIANYIGYFVDGRDLDDFDTNDQLRTLSNKYTLFNVQTLRHFGNVIDAFGLKINTNWRNVMTLVCAHTIVKYGKNDRYWIRLRPPVDEQIIVKTIVFTSIIAIIQKIRYLRKKNSDHMTANPFVLHNLLNIVINTHMFVDGRQNIDDNVIFDNTKIFTQTNNHLFEQSVRQEFVDVLSSLQIGKSRKNGEIPIVVKNIMILKDGVKMDADNVGRVAVFNPPVAGALPPVVPANARALAGSAGATNPPIPLVLVDDDNVLFNFVKFVMVDSTSTFRFHVYVYNKNYK
jgi:hypothetical protein